jgi:hypothetical protein
MPATVKETVKGAFVQHDSSVDFFATSKNSVLYPGGIVQGKDKRVFPVKLLTALRVVLVDSIAIEGVELAACNYWADLILRGPELWEKRRSLVDTRTLAPGTRRIEVSLDIPIVQIHEEISKIEEEISIAPSTGNYDVEIRLHTQMRFVGREDLNHYYVSVYPFTFIYAKLALEAPKKLELSQRYGKDTVRLVPNTVPIGGKPYDVGSLQRYSSILLAFTLSAAVAAVGWSVSIGRREPQDPARFCRDRLIKVHEIASSAFDSSVRVRDIHELARVADEAQVLLMELVGPRDVELPAQVVATPSPALQGRKFFAIANGTLFYVI